MRWPQAIVVASLLMSSPLLAGDRPQKSNNAEPAQTLAKSERAAEADSPQPVVETVEVKTCHWWQFGLCKDSERSTEITLPPEAPRTGSVIAVDTSTNILYLFKDGDLVARGPVATGTEKTLKKGTKVWMFHTPRGRLKVLRKIDDPVWRKPDWAFVEAGERVPPADSPKRLIKGKLGKYALDLGDGILIHGTAETDSLGRKASHGCVRVGSELLERVYQSAAIGTDVFIY
jgi:lipoprotein-anchoring transpeptidase ErfK/SrfK